MSWVEDLVVLDAVDLGDVDDLAGAVLEPGGVDDDVDGGRHLLADRPQRQLVAGHQHHGLEPPEHVLGAVGVTGRQRPVVTGGHRLEHVERLACSALADDDAVGAHVHRVPQQAPDRDLALALQVRGLDSSVITWSWRSWSSAASSIVTIRSSFGMNDERTLRVVVLPDPVPPDTNRLSRASMHAWRKSNISGVAVPNRMRSSTVYGVLRELADRDDRADQRERLDDGVHA